MKLLRTFSTRRPGARPRGSRSGWSAAATAGRCRPIKARPTPTVGSGCPAPGGAGDFEPGVYRITFGTGAYFTARGSASFYPEVTITFEMTARDEHYHVPLLLSPYAYSTYRGS